MACVAGLGAAAWRGGGTYASWELAAQGLGVNANAVVHGGANFLAHVGIPSRFGRALLAVTIVAFALTTLDSATRLLRFNVEEICRSVGLDVLANRYFASLWPWRHRLLRAGAGRQDAVDLFGTTNQLLAGLTLLTVSVFLYKLRRPVIYTLVPMVLMLAMSIWAMVLSLIGFWPANRKVVALIGMSAVVLAMAVWLIVEAPSPSPAAGAD